MPWPWRRKRSRWRERRWLIGEACCGGRGGHDGAVQARRYPSMCLQRHGEATLWSTLVTELALRASCARTVSMQSFAHGWRWKLVGGKRPWNASVPACASTGIQCDAANAMVVDLHLPGIGLIGSVPPGTLGGCRDSRSSRCATMRGMDARRRRVGGGSDAAGAGRARQSGAEEGQSGMGWVGRLG